MLLLIRPEITGVDTGIVVGYFVLVLTIGYVLARRTTTGTDYFLAGKRLRWTAIGFSLFASNISSSSIIGLTGSAYASGISIANYEWMAAIILVIMAIFIIPIYLKNKLVTVPQYLELRYSPFVRQYYSLVTIVLTIIVDIASSLFAGALVIKVFYPDISVTTACYAMALLSGLYTTAGGLAAVVYTDMLQAIILIIGGIIMLFSVLGQFDFDWNTAIGQIDPARLSFILPKDDPNLPWMGTVIGVSVLGFYYWVTNQYVVQRVLAARDVNHARWGALLAGFLKLGILFLFVFPGVMSLSLFPSLDNSDMVYPAMLLNLIPSGVKGIVLAGLIAAIMSSVDSALNGSSTLIVFDFIRPRRPKLSESELMKYGRYTTIMVMLVAGIWAPVIENFQGLFNYLQQVLAFSVPPVVCVFILGIFWRRGTPMAAKYTLIFGHLLCLVTLILQNEGWFDTHFTITAGILFFICMLGYILVSLSGSRPDISDLEGLIWTREHRISSGPYPWYLRVKFLSALLTIATLLLLMKYW